MLRILFTYIFILILNFAGPANAQQVYVSTIQLTSPLSLDGLIVADDGTLYGAEGYNGSRIYEINMDGTSSIFASSLSGPIDMDFDNEENLYVTTFNNSGVYKITPSGVVSRYATVTIGPSGIIINRQTKDLFVSHFGSAPFSGNTVYKVDSSGSSSVFVQDSRLKSPVSLAIDDSANLFTPNIGDSKLFKITSEGDMTLFASLPTSSAMFNIGHIAFANGKLYLTGNTGKHYLYEVESDGSYKIIAGTGVPGSQDGEGLTAQFNGPNGIAASVTGDTLFISELNNPSTIRVVDLNAPTGIENSQDKLTGYNLLQNYPNPFNPETTIEFNLASSGNISLSVYNTLGQEIKLLFSGYYNAGRHRIRWNGKDSEGNNVSSGVYFYKLKTGNSFLTGKMLLSK
jgi:sugar lactone lactonase YvrE